MSKPFRLLWLLLCITLSSGVQANKDTISKAQAATLAQKHTKGRVLKVDSGKQTHRVKVLTSSGRVVTVTVDKVSGKVTAGRKKDN